MAWGDLLGAFCLPDLIPRVPFLKEDPVRGEEEASCAQAGPDEGVSPHVGGHSLRELCAPSLLGPEGDEGRRDRLELRFKDGVSRRPHAGLGPHQPIHTAPPVPLPMPTPALCQVFYKQLLNPGNWVFSATFHG